MYAALKYIRDELSANLAMAPDVAGDMVVLGSVHEADGSISGKVTDKIVLSLVNVERATFQGRSPVARSAQGVSLAVHSAPLHLNLLLLLTASFIDYQEALKKLEATAAFFQSHSDMTRQSLITIPAGVDKLDIQLENMSFHEMSNLWGMMGGKHFPCLLYKLRMITVDDQALLAMQTAISKPSVDVGS